MSFVRVFLGESKIQINKGCHMLRNWPIVLLAAVLVVIIGVSCYTDPSYQDKQKGAGNSSPTAGIAQNETTHSSQETQTTKHPPRGWRKLFVWPEGVTALALFLTLFFIGWQALLMRQTILSSEDSSKRELRAYLAVAIGEALYQERRQAPLSDLKFEARPLLLNTGRTPAHNIQFKARAAIFPVPLPKEIGLPETYDLGDANAMLSANQSANMFAVVDGFCGDDEVGVIKDGSAGKGLYVWGLVTYEDIFGISHHTRFCQHVYWTMGGQIRGVYIPGRNDAT
jgi:hypothetical protein